VTVAGGRDVRAEFSGTTCTFVVDSEPVLHCSAGVRLSDGRVLTTVDVDPPTLRWSLERVDACALILRLGFTNQGNAPLGVEQLLPLVSESGFRSLAVDGLQVSETGWQSWTRAHPLRPFYDNAATAPAPIRSPILPHREPGSQVIGWMTVLRGADSGACLLGFLRGRDQTCVLEVAPRTGGHALRASAEVEGALLSPGATLTSEPLLVAFGEEADLVSRYADMVAHHSAARVPAYTPTGWCSWYEFFTRVTKRDVLRNLALLDGARDRLPLDLVQLDDGYQHEVGDWLDLQPTFPSGIRSLSDAVHDRGYGLVSGWRRSCSPRARPPTPSIRTGSSATTPASRWRQSRTGARSTTGWTRRIRRPSTGWSMCCVPCAMSGGSTT
jgi:hypothetical protein